jgi:GMP synthase-like glutamine amidotransferase
MRLLSVVHGPEVRGEVFDDVLREDGHELDEWWFARDSGPPRRLDAYDAVLLFGGAQNVDQEDEHAWLRREDDFVRGLVEHEVPTLGVCLGAQLLAKAAGAHVGPSPEPEFGFTRVELAAGAAGDPLFGGLPWEFDVWNAHGYAFEVPNGGVELARSRVCSQAFRLGSAAWGVQFHPEIRVEQVARWLTEDRVPNAGALVEELRSRYDEWRGFGARLLRSFVAAAGASERGDDVELFAHRGSL